MALKARVVSLKPTVLIVDSHPIMRLGITLIVGQSREFLVCGEAGDAASAFACVVRLKPDLVVLDLGLGGRDGIELVREIRILNSATRILVYSAFPEKTYARRVFQAGGHGYLRKDDGAEKLPIALAALVRGERYASPEMQALFFQEFAGGGRMTTSDDPLVALSSREIQVLRLVGMGRALREVSRELSLSVKTVGTHRERLKNKLGVENARDLSRMAAEWVRVGQL